MGEKQAKNKTVTEGIVRLKKIQDDIAYQTSTAGDARLSLVELSGLSQGARLIKKIENSGSAIGAVSGYIAEYPASSANSSLTQGFQLGAVVLYAFSFLYIPFLYLKAYLYNQKIPFTLSNNSQWLYSAILLGLMLAAVLVPAAAIVIAFVIAGLGLGASVLFLGQALVERYKLSRESKALERALQQEKQGLLDIQKEANSLEKALTSAIKSSELIDIFAQIALLDERYQAQQKTILNLYVQQAQNKECLKEHDIKNIDKSLAVILASATVIGLVVSLLFPPAGFAILASVAVIGAVYVLGRIGLPFVQILDRWSLAGSAHSEYDALHEDDDCDRSYFNEHRTDLSREVEPSSLAEVHRSLDESTVSVLSSLVSNDDTILAVDQKDEPVPEPTAPIPFYSPCPAQSSTHNVKAEKKPSPR